MTDRSESLYQRIGGSEAVGSLIDAFYERVLIDPELAPFFVDAEMPTVRNMQREFFGAALGGPIRYGGRSLIAIHAGRGIRVRHFARFVEHLLETLREQGVDDDDVYEVIARVNTYVDQITGDATIGA